jgi:hypothetical protein
MSRSWLMAAAVIALLQQSAHGQNPPADRFAPILADYRADPACLGATYETAIHAIEVSLTAYHVQNPARVQDSLVAGVTTAAQLDRLADVAAAKGCRPQALEIWWVVIRHFDGPAFTSFQRRAVAGLRALRGRHPA